MNDRLKFEAYRPLGRTGVLVSPITLGCWQFGDRVDPRQAARLIDVALDRGINVIDTADVYGRSIGSSETIVGKALADSRRRDRVVLGTKAFFPTDDSDPNMRGVSRRYLIHACEASLRRLGVDHVDIFYVHRPDPAVPIDETLRALDDLIRSGKVRYIGTSTSTAWRFVEAIHIARELGVNRYVAETPPYNLLDRRIERELIPMAQAYGVAMSVWSPLAGGILTGIYKRDQAPPDGSRFADSDYQDKFGFRLTERVYAVTDTVTELAEKKGCTPAQFALAWVLRAPGITSAVVGPERVEDLDASLAALDVEITEDDRRRIDAVIRPGEHVSSFYEESPAWARTLAEISGPEAQADAKRS